MHTSRGLKNTSSYIGAAHYLSFRVTHFNNIPLSEPIEQIFWGQEKRALRAKYEQYLKLYPHHTFEFLKCE
jgi:hypothetical protein